MDSKKLLHFSAVAAVLFTIFSGALASAAQTETLSVDVLSSRLLVFSLTEGAKLRGSLSISGGSENDIDFYVTDFHGSRVADLGRVSGEAAFEFQASEPGNYILHFDNSFSWFSPKAVTLSYDVEGATPPPPLKPRNVSLSPVVEGAIITGLVLIAVAVAIWLRRRKNFSQVN